MLGVATRCTLVIALAGLLAAACGAGASTARSHPTRPGGSTSRTAQTAPAPHRIEGKYVDVVEMAATLGLHGKWLEHDKRFLLTGGDRRVELEVNSREVLVNGLRVFLGEPVSLHTGRPRVGRVDFDSCLKPMLRPDLLGGLPRRPRIIAIDPGHGGTDNGMENRRLGLKEKVLTLDVAQRLRKLLEARGYKVVLTRTSDKVYSEEKRIDLPMRGQVANRYHADLFVSIHFNSLYPDTHTSGTEVYVFTRAGQESDRSIGLLKANDAEREPSPVNRYDAWSALLAHLLHRDIIGELKTVDRGQKTMHAAVLRPLDCPGVLVESLFLSNDREARQAATPAYRERIAAAIAAGIEDYAKLLDSLHAKH